MCMTNKGAMRMQLAASCLEAPRGTPFMYLRLPLPSAFVPQESCYSHAATVFVQTLLALPQLCCSRS